MEVIVWTYQSREWPVTVGALGRGRDVKYPKYRFNQTLESKLHSTMHPLIENT